MIISFQAEEFIAQVEELGHVRHKNLVNLLGYCMEGAHRYQILFLQYHLLHICYKLKISRKFGWLEILLIPNRMIVCEYVDNKSLHHWLHQCPEQLSPLTWSTRMNIIQGIARGWDIIIFPMLRIEDLRIGGSETEMVINSFL